MDRREILKLPTDVRNKELERQVAEYLEHDEETNDGKGWAGGTWECVYCGRPATHVYPADMDPATLPCGYCGLREKEPEAKN